MKLIDVVTELHDQILNMIHDLDIDVNLILKVTVLAGELNSVLVNSRSQILKMLPSAVLSYFSHEPYSGLQNLIQKVAFT